MGMPLAVLDRLRRAAGAPGRILFSAGEQGFWYDPSDLTTLFQDTAGTTPVTAPGQTVALVLDKSGGGNHATQSTTANRPTYGIVPKTGRRNLLTWTEDFSNAVWGSPVGATWTAISGAEFGAYRLAEDSSTGLHRLVPIASQVSFVFGLTYVASVEVKLFSGTRRVRIGSGSSATINYAADFDLVSGTVISGPGTITSLGDGWFRLATTATAVSSGNLQSHIIQLLNGATASYAGDGTSAIDVRKPQLELGSTATAYQRVTTQFDVTEAGVASDHYLFFGGSTDPRWMVTPTITPGTDKVQVFAGVRKLSDAAEGGLFEASTGSGNGRWRMAAPSSSLGNVSFSSLGTINVGVARAAAAPISVTATGIGDIGGDLARVRVNSTLISQSSADQGTSDYLAYPVYIGARGGTSLQFNGQLFSAILRYGSNLSNDTIEQVERWIAVRTGVAL